MNDVLHLHGLGAVIEVHCAGDAASELAAAMRTAWSRCLHPHEITTTPVTAKALDVRLDDPSTLPRELTQTTRRITRALIAARAGQLCMLHAGAVSDVSTGRTLVVVAQGGMGKTTMSRHLGRRLGYVTDETVGIDDVGRILPYPKPLSVRHSAGRATKEEVSPDSLALLDTPSHPYVSQLVLLDRRPDGTGDLSADPFMDALVALVGQSSSLSELRSPLQRLADLIDDVGPVLRVRYREARDAEEALVKAVTKAP